jgi:hypothetical protein
MVEPGAGGVVVVTNGADDVAVPLEHAAAATLRAAVKATTGPPICKNDRFAMTRSSGLMELVAS